MSATEPDTFPRQYARTRRFSLGEPRAIQVAPDGSRVIFLRSRGGSDARTSLWTWDAESGAETPVADPVTLLAAGTHEITDAERARRERAREQAEGITSYATDLALSMAAYALSGRLFATDLATGMTKEVAAQAGVFDPRPSPDGTHIAYVSDRCLRVVGATGDAETADRLLAGDHVEHVSWGTAEFIAAEELNRFRGFWWAPDSARIAAARVDVSPVVEWYIADPAYPERPARAHRYPAAGTANADVSLAVIDVATGAHTPVEWDRRGYPYLVEVVWSAGGGLALVVMDRAQKTQRILVADPASGATHVVHEITDDAWVELTPGTPVWLDDGRLVTTEDDGATDTRRLMIGDRAVSPPGMQVRRVIDASADAVVFSANETATPWSVGLWAIDPRRADVAPHPIARSGDAVLDATVAGSIAVVRVSSLDDERASVQVWRDAATAAPTLLGEIRSLAETPLVFPRPTLQLLGRRALPVAVILPADPELANRKLPVLMDPYGGPHAQRVVASRMAYATSQWLADQGFAVVVVDGRGTPGKGPRFDRGVHLDLAGPVLDDQVDGLHEAACRYPQLDLTRVAIRGWSFGGYLAALAVLRRPDVFHAAVAGAPVTEWRLYDTGYTERYLGNPVVDPAPYDRCSLLLDAHLLTRPLMLIHGLADDNVVAAHTLRFSSALLAAGRPHEVLPLSGVTHMTPQEVVAENQLLLQVEFIKRSLQVGGPRWA